MSDAFLASAAATAVRQPGTSWSGSESILRELFSRVVYSVSTVPQYYIFTKMSKRFHGQKSQAFGLFLTCGILPVLSACRVGTKPHCPRVVRMRLKPWLMRKWSAHGPMSAALSAWSPTVLYPGSNSTRLVSTSPMQRMKRC